MSDEIRAPSAFRSNLARCSYARGDPGVQSTAVQEGSVGPELSSIYGVRLLTYSPFCKADMS